MPQKIFSEEQTFNQWWLWVLMFAALAGMTLSFINKYEDSTDFMFSMLLGYGVVLLVILLLWRLRLKTHMDENGITLNFWPLLIKQKQIKWNEIDKAEVIKYSPLMDYGGWGYRIRLGGKGRAVNVKGNQGIKLHLKNGKTFLIGTQNPEEAKMVISNYLKS